MKFLVDVNASGVLSTLLVELGHEVACVKDVNPRMGDDEIIAWAVREERVIFTAVVIATKQKIRIRRKPSNDQVQ